MPLRNYIFWKEEPTMLCCMFQEFTSWLESSTPEHDVPQLWEESKPLSMFLYDILLTTTCPFSVAPLLSQWLFIYSTFHPLICTVFFYNLYFYWPQSVDTRFWSRLLCVYFLNVISTFGPFRKQLQANECKVVKKITNSYKKCCGWLWCSFKDIFF